MKKSLLRFRVIGLFIAFVLWSAAVEGGRFYVVVATFSDEHGARDFAVALQEVYREASFTYDNDRNLYYVHVMKTDQQDEAHHFRHSLRTDAGFKDAWIFTDVNKVKLSGDGHRPSNGEPVRLELFNGGSVLLSSADNSYLSISKQGKVKTDDALASPMGFVILAETAAGNSLPGQVYVLDQRGQDLAAFKTEEVISFGGKELAHTLTVVCQVAGYHPEAKVIDLSNFTRIPDITMDEDGIWKVHFRLTKANVDEINLLYHDMFHPDAAIFREESKKQLSVLRALLKANPEWRIAISSHSNPGGKRDIFLPGKASDPFDISAALERSGTDKTLTRARADALTAHLIDHGIDPRRIAAMGWGSLDPVVKLGKKNAALNERIEVQCSR